MENWLITLSFGCVCVFARTRQKCTKLAPSIFIISMILRSCLCVTNTMCPACCRKCVSLNKNKWLTQKQMSDSEKRELSRNWSAWKCRPFEQAGYSTTIYFYTIKIHRIVYIRQHFQTLPVLKNKSHNSRLQTICNLSQKFAADTLFGCVFSSAQCQKYSILLFFCCYSCYCCCCCCYHTPHRMKEHSSLLKQNTGQIRTVFVEQQLKMGKQGEDNFEFSQTIMFKSVKFMRKYNYITHSSFVCFHLILFTPNDVNRLIRLH